ncbi:MAG: SprT-like domain-containing protein [Polyangiaceae bacterium]|nr:SprT-like domain-containing protein [Polyangiaceae bacterium]
MILRLEQTIGYGGIMQPGSHDLPLSDELRRIAQSQVQRTYQELNWGLFSGKLQKPSFEWLESGSRWGAWLSSRVMQLNLSLLDGPWGQLVEVLKHEMAHQFVDQVLRVDDEPAHGPTFQRVCRERGIDSRAAGAPRMPQELEQQISPTLERIQKLLSLAQSENQHEAENAMAKARKLMLRYNIDENALGERRDYSYRHLGKSTGRRQAWQRVLASILSEHFFVEVVIVPCFRVQEGKRGTILEACGTIPNLEIASYVHDFLERAGEELWRAHKSREGLKRNKNRQSFLYGVMMGFADKLRRGHLASAAEGLVWSGDPELDAFLRRRHPYLRRVGGKGAVDRDAFTAGQQAGKKLVIHRGLSQRSIGGSPRLLKGSS